MWASILTFVFGGVVLGIVLFVRQYFTNTNKIEQLRDINEVAADRLTAVEEQAQADRTKRLKDIENEAETITAANDATAALDLLRKQFPKRNNSTTGSQMHLPGVP